MKKAGKKVYVRRYEPYSSSTISSVSDFSSSASHGKWNMEVNRQAGLATKINICSLGNAPPNTNFASWNFDPEAKKKAKKKKEKEKRDKEKKREVGGHLSAKFAGMDTSAMLKTTPNELSATPATPQPALSSWEPLIESPSSADQSGLHGEPLNSSTSSDSGVPCIHGLLIGILVLSLIGLIIVAYFVVIRRTTEDTYDRETLMMKHPDARAILRMATKPYRLRHPTNKIDT
ncbi:hypothetical protein HPB50_013046 [Hyalomma asiaticum]|uniref:Uncharacterized protein n=1 Tax=Hyalomma asiaticum TaxID=266040 RepID=A0ACB7S0J7_HYAAI|nr:hypothetical protein HPB50_013046 [Hyalomma asiaticum]